MHYITAAIERGLLHILCAKLLYTIVTQTQILFFMYVVLYFYVSIFHIPYLITFSVQYCWMNLLLLHTILCVIYILFFICHSI